MPTIGLHLRLTTDFAHMIQKAVRLELPSFQCFLTHQSTGKHTNFTRDLIPVCKEARSTFDYLYVHGSYSINLAHQSCGQPLLKKELELAKRLQFTHLVLHPGSVMAQMCRMSSIDATVRTLNTVLKREDEITIVLENSAHGSKALAGDIRELALIRSKLDAPEKIKFCIDTAHAHVFGYNLVTVEHQQAFIKYLDKTLGSNGIALIHLNDTQEELGSKIDRHCLLGEGILGAASLKQFMRHPLWHTTPVILELPTVSEEEERQALMLAQTWLDAP
jgi:deoxyribonuclease IV